MTCPKWLALLALRRLTGGGPQKKKGPWVLGSDFFEKNPKNGFWGEGVCVEKIDFFGEVVVEKIDCAGDKMRLFSCSDLIHAVPSPFVRCSVLTLSQPCEYPA